MLSKRCQIIQPFSFCSCLPPEPAQPTQNTSQNTSSYTKTTVHTQSCPTPVQILSKFGQNLETRVQILSELGQQLDNQVSNTGLCAFQLHAHRSFMDVAAHVSGSDSMLLIDAFESPSEAMLKRVRDADAAGRGCTNVFLESASPCSTQVFHDALCA